MRGLFAFLLIVAGVGCWSFTPWHSIPVAVVVAGLLLIADKATDRPK